MTLDRLTGDWSFDFLVHVREIQGRVKHARAMRETYLRSHEPPRNKPGELEHDPQPSTRRD